MLKSKLLFIALVLFIAPEVMAKPDYASLFKNREGCFLAIDISSGRTLAHYNAAFCNKRFPPCSTFKPVVALMAFEERLIADEHSVLPWDVTIHDREVLNQDQTPISWMQLSVNWVNERMIEQMGDIKVQQYLEAFDYGSEDFSQGEVLSAQQPFSLTISANEQLQFLRRLWTNNLPVSADAMRRTRTILKGDSNTKNQNNYGKTGSCCIDASCMSGAGRQLGWYIGIVESDKKSIAYVVNFIDQKPMQGYAGAAAYQIAEALLASLQSSVE